MTPAWYPNDIPLDFLVGFWLKFPGHHLPDHDRTKTVDRFFSKIDPAKSRSKTVEISSGDMKGYTIWFFKWKTHSKWRFLAGTIILMSSRYLTR